VVAAGGITMTVRPEELASASTRRPAHLTLPQGTSRATVTKMLQNAFVRKEATAGTNRVPPALLCA
jgi:hypothetical protein